MIEPQLPIPEPKEWFTITGAAEMIGVSPATVRRLIDAHTLTAHRPCGGTEESVPIMLHRTEVRDVCAARRRLGLSRV